MADDKVVGPSGLPEDEFTEGWSAKGIAGGAQELERKARLRQAANVQGYGLASTSRQSAAKLGAARAGALAGMDKATASGRMARQTAAAEGLAAAQGGSGKMGGGGMYAATQQAAQTSGNDVAQFEGQQAAQRGQMDFGMQQKVGDLEVDAASQDLEATKAEMAAGSATLDKQAAMGKAKASFDAIVAKHKHWYGDDEDMMQEELRMAAANEIDPEVAKWLNDQVRLLARV